MGKEPSSLPFGPCFAPTKISYLSLSEGKAMAFPRGTGSSDSIEDVLAKYAREKRIAPMLESLLIQLVVQREYSEPVRAICLSGYFWRVVEFVVREVWTQAGLNRVAVQRVTFEQNRIDVGSD